MGCGDDRRAHREVARMKKIVREIIFFLLAAAVILPTPTLVWTWVTGKTISEVLCR
jgi:hypothetical protein